MCQKIDIGGFEASLQEDGSWLYKAKEAGQPVKKTSYKDVPQYLAAHSIEQEFKLTGQQMIRDSVTEIVKFLKT